MTAPMLDKLIRFQHPGRVFGFAQNLTDQTMAAIFGVDHPQYQSVLAELDGQRSAAAVRLAADPQVRADLHNVAVKKDAHVVAIGESTTADRLSWFELLRTLFDTERPDLGLRFDNLAVAGATTTQVLARLPEIRRQSADVLFCMLGANDAQRFGTHNVDPQHGDTGAGPRLVTAAETHRNLRELRARALPNAASCWVWVTPTPVNEALVAAFPFFRTAGISWANADIAETSASLIATDDLVIDSAPVVTAASAEPLLEDGVHPRLATQEALAARVVAALAKAATR